MRRASGIANDRGNALVLAVLILLALTSVGVVSINRTNMDLLVAGNVVRSMQAQLGGEAGTEHGLGLVGAMPDKSSRDIKRNRDLAMGHSGVTQTADDDPNLTLTKEQFAYSTAVPDPSGAGIGQHLPVVSGLNPLARSRQDIAYNLSITFLYPNENAPGWGTDGKICHYSYDFNSWGGVPSKSELLSDTLPDPYAPCPPYRDSVTVEFRARGVVGPVPCQ